MTQYNFLIKLKGKIIPLERHDISIVYPKLWKKQKGFEVKTQKKITVLSTGENHEVIDSLIPRLPRSPIFSVHLILKFPKPTKLSIMITKEVIILAIPCVKINMDKWTHQERTNKWKLYKTFSPCCNKYSQKFFRVNT